ISDGTVLHQSPETVDTKRAMFYFSVKRILLADHTKFERLALHSFAALDEFDVVIVDIEMNATSALRALISLMVMRPMK
ncbi:hypothetical protein ACCS66_38820, partial [Rhizobium ruizarguesonis]